MGFICFFKETDGPVQFTRCRPSARQRPWQYAPIPVSERLQGFSEDADERRYLESGADAFRRWHEEGERRAPLDLGEMLKQA